LVEIIFQKESDAIRFYNHLLSSIQVESNRENVLLFEDRYIVGILDSDGTEDFFKEVKTAFYEFITKIKRDDWFRDILKSQFYFEDFEEQQQILEIIHSILKGQREELSVFVKPLYHEPLIKDSIDQVFQKGITLSLDSFLKFRLRVYFQQLESYVEVAIDEYKMEQEYQMFISMLRDFLADRESKMQVLHVLLDEEVTFYNEQFNEMKRSELTKMIDRKLLVNHPVYIDSATIAPLLSLAPTRIYLYTKDEEAPLVRTIKNIFEERVILKKDTDLFEVKQEPQGHSEKMHNN